MKTFRKSHAFLGGLLTMCGLAGSLCAQTATTDPVGAITLTLKGGSDTAIALPFHRPVALETQVMNIASNVITVASTAGLVANQFLYVAGTQPNTYYLQFTTGQKAGMFYTVTANSATTITVNPNNDSTLNTLVSTADTFRIIPYWTLNTLFPGGAGTYQTSSQFSPASSILVPDSTTAGTNLSASAVYFYFNGTSNGPGWRKLNDATKALYPDLPLVPDSYLTVRHPVNSADTQLVVVGSVPMSAQSVIVNTLANNIQQDNAVSLPVPANITLGASGLYPNIVAGSSSVFSPVDSLLVFDPTAAGQNKSASAVYFYYTGTGNGGPGWRRLLADKTALQTNVVLSPGYGFIIRKAAQSTHASVVWTYTPAYLSN